MLKISDNDLILRIQEGNKTAFDNLFIKYYKPLYRFALHFCNNAIIAEESVQKTFIKIWQNNSKQFDNNDIGKILFAYTKNEVIDELRKLNVRAKYEGNSIYEKITDDNSDEINKQRVKAIIENAIEQLPAKAKEIFRLAKQEGLTTNEIAKHLTISNKTVENQMTIAYKKLRLYLEPFKNHLRF